MSKVFAKKSKKEEANLPQKVESNSTEDDLQKRKEELSKQRIKSTDLIAMMQNEDTTMLIKDDDLSIDISMMPTISNLDEEIKKHTEVEQQIVIADKDNGFAKKEEEKIQAYKKAQSKAENKNNISLGIENNVTSTTEVKELTEEEKQANEKAQQLKKEEEERQEKEEQEKENRKKINKEAQENSMLNKTLDNDNSNTKPKEKDDGKPNEEELEKPKNEEQNQAKESHNEEPKLCFNPTNSPSLEAIKQRNKEQKTNKNKMMFGEKDIRVFKNELEKYEQKDRAKKVFGVIKTKFLEKHFINKDSSSISSFNIFNHLMEKLNKHILEALESENPNSKLVFAEKYPNDIYVDINVFHKIIFDALKLNDMYLVSTRDKITKDKDVYFQTLDKLFEKI
jgi:hypothetical protein